MEHTVLQDVTDDYSIIIPKVEHFLKGKFAKRVKEWKLDRCQCRVKETKHKLWLKNMIKTIFFTRTTLYTILHNFKLKRYFDPDEY